MQTPATKGFRISSCAVLPGYPHAAPRTLSGQSPSRTKSSSPMGKKPCENQERLSGQRQMQIVSHSLFNNHPQFPRQLCTTKTLAFWWCGRAQTPALSDPHSTSESCIGASCSRQLRHFFLGPPSIPCFNIMELPLENQRFVLCHSPKPHAIVICQDLP